MDDFLYRLYRLANNTRKTPKEDFASLAVGRHLESDPDFARELFGQVALALREHRTAAARAAADRVEAWCATRTRDRHFEIRAQVPARTGEGGADGAVDLLVRLLAGGQRQELVIEAKVGEDHYPYDEQLQRYAQAFRDAAVIALVEASAARQIVGWPVLTWDQVVGSLPGIGTDPDDLQDMLRRDLRDLFAAAGLGDLRQTMHDTDWSAAVRASRWFHDKLQPCIEQMLVQLGHNDAARDQISAAVRPGDDEAGDAWDEPWESWGLGVLRGQPLAGTRILGLCLGVDAGPYPDQVTWRLELTPSNEALRAWLRSEDAPSWWEVRGDRDRFVTDLLTTEGDGNLGVADLRAVVAAARDALRMVHSQGDTRVVLRGPGEVARGPRGVSIRALREGIARWSRVNDALWVLLRDTAQRLCDAAGAGRPRADDGDLRTPPLPGPGGSRVRLRAGPHLQTLEVEVEAGGDAVLARLRERAAAWSGRQDSPGPVEVRAGDSTAVLHLRAGTWRSDAVGACLLDLARAGVGLD